MEFQLDTIPCPVNVDSCYLDPCTRDVGQADACVPSHLDSGPCKAKTAAVECAQRSLGGSSCCFDCVESIPRVET